MVDRHREQFLGLLTNSGHVDLMGFDICLSAEFWSDMKANIKGSDFPSRSQNPSKILFISMSHKTYISSSVLGACSSCSALCASSAKC